MMGKISKGDMRWAMEPPRRTAKEESATEGADAEALEIAGDRWSTAE